jgi:hypothetical protein
MARDEKAHNWSADSRAFGETLLLFAALLGALVLAGKVIGPLPEGVGEGVIGVSAVVLFFYAAIRQWMLRRR